MDNEEDDDNDNDGDEDDDDDDINEFVGYPLPFTSLACHNLGLIPTFSNHVDVDDSDVDDNDVDDDDDACDDDNNNNPSPAQTVCPGSPQPPSSQYSLAPQSLLLR